MTLPSAYMVTLTAEGALSPHVSKRTIATHVGLRLWRLLRRSFHHEINMLASASLINDGSKTINSVLLPQRPPTPSK